MKLSEIFKPVIDSYSQSDFESGEFLFDLFQNSWNVFSDRAIKKISSNKNDILSDIMLCNVPYDEICLEPDYSGFFTDTGSDLLSDIDDRMIKLFRNDKKVWNLQKDSFWEYDVLETVFEDLLTTEKKNKLYYRARLHTSKDLNHYKQKNIKFEKNDMGMPPVKKVKAGRINRKNKPVLYLSSSISTAISEVRPVKECAVAVSKVSLKKDFRIVDVSKKLEINTPFFNENIKWTINIKELLDRFYMDFSLPLDYMDKDELYKPTQMISLLIKKSGYDGIKYKSALGNGYNIALFSDTDVKIKDPDYYFINKISYSKTKDISKSCFMYDEHHYDWLR
ncbi:MAG: RES family NAD+ phosphorylase [Ignavibacteriaceae bacterium]|nr:RES family NAD+ phosphorylase [Ignavibacteriaceae bacterium]